MKQLVTTLLLISLISGLQAQDKKKVLRSTGISTNASLLEHSVRGQLEPYVSLGTDNKQITLGPTILVASNIGYQSPQTPRLTGGRIGYRFLPGTLNNKWAFHISADFRIQRLKDTWNSNWYNEQISEYQEYTIKTVELLIENYVGYGLEFKISKSLSISQGVGFGWYMSNLDANAHMSDLVDYRGYDDVGFLLNARFEISYNFSPSKQ